MNNKKINHRISLKLGVSNLAPNFFSICLQAFNICIINYLLQSLEKNYILIPINII